MSDFPVRADIGEVVAQRYELLQVIGEGGMARVFRGRDRLLNRIVAIKLLREEYGADPAFVARFQREARAIASLSSPNIVDIYDYGTHNDTYYIVMEFVDGADLNTLLKQEGRLPLARAVTFVEQILHALAEAHAHGIVHRDVKPQNILIRSEDNLVKLTDFGIAHARDDMQITSTGMALGTVKYMAPEQASGGHVSPATDIYAVGVLFFQLLAGQLPFTGESPMAVLFAHSQTPPPTLASVGVIVPDSIERIIQRALAKNPAQRYQSADDMRAALASFANPQAAVINEAPTRVVPSHIEQPIVQPPRPLRVAAPPPAPVYAPQAPTRVAAPTRPSPAPRPQPPRPVVAQPSTQRRRGVPIILLLLVLALLIGGALFAFSRLSGTSSPSATVTASTSNTSTASTVPASADAQRAAGTITAQQISDAYRRDDGTLFGRPEVALYGLGSGYNQGRATFSLASVPATMGLTLTGLDDERSAHCGFQILVNGTVIYDDADTFPNTPGNDNGVGGKDRNWGQMHVSVPAKALKVGQNNLTLINTSPGTSPGIPYILINTIAYSVS